MDSKITSRGKWLEKLLPAIFFLAVFSVFAFSLYKFWYAKDFYMLVEAPCDSASSSCETRDCEADDCPPNGLESYQTFRIAAKDFVECQDGTCLNECTEQKIQCEVVNSEAQ